MKMLKYKATFRDDSAFVPWMFGIARNACVAHLRRASVDLVPEEQLDREPVEGRPRTITPASSRPTSCGARCSRCRSSGARCSC